MKNIKYLLNLVTVLLFSTNAWAHPGHHHEGSHLDVYGHNILTVLLPVFTLVAVSVFFILRRISKQKTNS